MQVFFPSSVEKFRLKAGRAEVTYLNHGEAHLTVPCNIAAQKIYYGRERMAGKRKARQLC